MKNEEKNNHRWNTVIEVRTLFLLISEKKFKHPNLNFASNRMKRSRCKYWFDIYFLCLSLSRFLPSSFFYFVFICVSRRYQRWTKLNKNGQKEHTEKNRKIRGTKSGRWNSGTIRNRRDRNREKLRVNYISKCTAHERRYIHINGIGFGKQQIIPRWSEHTRTQKQQQPPIESNHWRKRARAHLPKIFIFSSQQQ